MEKKMRRTASLISGAVLAVGIAGLAPAGAATAAPRGIDSHVSTVASTQQIHLRGTCGSVFNPGVGGGMAAWNLSCDPQGHIRITGWVEDINADGKCAYVRAVAGDNETMPTAKACPKGTVTNFDWKTSGVTARIDAYLYVV